MHHLFRTLLVIAPALYVDLHVSACDVSASRANACFATSMFFLRPLRLTHCTTTHPPSTITMEFITEMNNKTDKALNARVQALAPELFNRILDFVLETPTGVVKITNKYRPPIALQINRSSRETAKRYYGGNTTFDLTGVPTQAESRHQDSRFRPRKATTWLASLPVEHQHLLQRVHYSVPHYNMLDDDDLGRIEEAIYEVYFICDELESCEIEVNDDAIYVKLLLRPDLDTAETRWMNGAGLRAMREDLQPCKSVARSLMRAEH